MSKQSPAKVIPGVKLRGADKMARIPFKFDTPAERLPKPDWIRVRVPAGDGINRIKQKLRAGRLHTVCEEASCPNLPECFGGGTATFMIMGDICTRRCPFCDVGHGRPLALDPDEPRNLAQTVRDLKLHYVVITSVDRDDLRDGGAGHFAECIRETRALNPEVHIEILVPDFRGRMERALTTLQTDLPDVFNHNLETVPRLYKQCRPGSDYQWSLDLIKQFGEKNPHIPTKSGLMLGLGETIEEVEQVMADLRAHGCSMLTIGQYLQPSRDHYPVARYAHPDEFAQLGKLGYQMGFAHVASGPLVRSSYQADQQASGILATSSAQG